MDYEGLDYRDSRKSEAEESEGEMSCCEGGSTMKANNHELKHSNSSKTKQYPPPPLSSSSSYFLVIPSGEEEEGCSKLFLSKGHGAIPEVDGVRHVAACSSDFSPFA